MVQERGIPLQMLQYLQVQECAKSSPALEITCHGQALANKPMPD